MILNKKYLVYILPVLFLFHFSNAWGKSGVLSFSDFRINLRCDTDTIKGASNLPYPFTDQSGDAPPLYNPDGGLRLSDPSNIKTDVQYNPNTGKYDIYQKIGGMDYRMPTEMDSDQYEDYMFQQAEHKYFKQKVASTTKEKQQTKSLIPPIHIGGNLFKDIFGSNTVNIRPQGSAELTFGFNNSKLENPALPVVQRSLTTFNFDENIQLNVTGEIGDKLKLSTSYNTKATFDFQNQMKLQFNGHEDDIIKSIDAGNVTFNLPGTLITGSQSLFGVKTKLQFGRLTSTTVYAQEKGNKKTLTVQNGAQTSNFNLKCDQYMANQHYFLSLFFRDQYDKALASEPVINTSVTITKIEVWVTNSSTATQNTRDILAFSDLGESAPYFTDGLAGPVQISPPRNNSTYYPPDNSVNTLNPPTFEAAHPGISGPTTAISTLAANRFQQVVDYEKIDLSRMLSTSEYTLNARLGYISLKQPLNYDQVLAVAYQYTYQGHTYQVGQFSTDGVPTGNELVVKMLKSTNVTPQVPLWKLMMKNIYALGSYQINSQNFMLNLWYSNPATGADVPYIPSGSLGDQALLRVMGLDQLDAEGDRVSDGMFDFIQGVTIDAANGYVILPSTEPFGSYLQGKLQAAGYSPASISNYVFQSLYDSILVAAQEQPNLDRYWIRGSFQSSASSDISLGAMNVPQGSVLVTAGGIKLTENVDYTVDYTLGRVKILNQGLLSSGTPIQISLENNALFSIESKTFFGEHFDYLLSKDVNLGATVVNYTEHPLTQIVSIGQEPVSNTMIGLNGDSKTDAPFLTRWIDALPMIHTKAPSEITTSNEIAAMIPGHPKYIGSSGNAYLDNFDGTESFIDISQPYSWFLASTPAGQPSVFPEAALNDSVPYGFNRALLNWFVVDPLFQQQTSGLTPANLTNADMSNNFTRIVLQTEIFPQEQSATGTPINLPVFNLAFYPTLKGPYNYDVGLTSVSAGINPDGTLKNPQTRWGGIQHAIQETDFQTDNIGEIEFWMMDPYNQDTASVPTYSGHPNTTGSLYFDLGDISEDVLKDGLKSFENGLPYQQADVEVPNNPNAPYTISKWGREPVNPSLVDAFNNDPTTRPFQDVGLDGLSDADERNFFNYYLNAVSGAFGGPSSVAALKADSDPSSDDYHYYRGDDYDAANYKVLKRYMKYNGLEGNSATQSQYGGLNSGGYPTTETTLPNTEDINQDNTLSQNEAYFEYQVKMDHNDVNSNNVGNNYITDAFTTTVSTINGNKQVTWYQFKIPLTDYIKKVGAITDFHSIRFIRMYMRGFDKPIICRFGKLELVRDDWRKYTGSLLAAGDYVPNDNLVVFNMYGVNLEENGSTPPVNYVIPPGIQRQLNLQSANLVQMNEGSLALQVCDLPDGDARGVYKNVQLDLRSYKDMQMFVHCQSADPSHALNTGDVTAFIRLGSDFTENYYEYEIPLQVTPPGSYNTNNNNDQTSVWPTANQMDMVLSKIENVKLARDAAMANPSSGASLQIPFTQKDGLNNITVVGNPTISNVQVILLGVRNPKRTIATEATDDGKNKCTEVWFDELRMTNFDEKGGWAAISRVTAKLADLGTLSLAGNITTPGFGSLETTISNLSRETDEGFSLATNLEMGKFLPQTWSVSIPMYVAYSDQVVIPEYNPLDPDILLKSAENTLTKTQQDSLRRVVISNTTQTSFNFTNVHKNKGKNSKKSHIYDIENFSLTYAYTAMKHHDVNTVEQLNVGHKAGLTYNYSFHPKNIQPLKKMDFFKKRKYLALLNDFNFFPLPDKFSATANLDREYSEFQIRNTIPGLLPLPLSVNKAFNDTRTYMLSFPITKSLKFDYTATDDARVLEPEGLPINTREQRDSVKEAFFNHQENTDFKQSVNVNYEVPINKIPGLDFLSLTAHYTGSYSWVHAPFAADSLGATIQNSSTKQLNGQINFTTLYNKIPFFRKMLQGDSKAKQPPMNKGVPGGKVSPPQQVQNPQDTGKNSKGGAYYAGQILIHLLTSIKNVSFSYSDNTGLVLPGYPFNSDMFGMDPAQHWAPGPGFAFGVHSDTSSFLNQVRNGGWQVPLSTAYTPVSAVDTKTFSAHASLEPLPDFKLDITATRTLSQSSSFYYHDSLAHGGNYYVIGTPTESGNFSMSYSMLSTVFKGNSLVSSLFNNYLSYRAIISRRLAYQPGSHSTKAIYGNPATDTAYYDGYSNLSQNVVIPAFLAAYSGKNPNTISLDPFPSIPLPNWTITYSGLAKLVPWVKHHLQSVILSNAYSSTYSVGSYNYNLLFAQDADGFPLARDVNNDFLPRNQIPAVTISDQFSPLIKIAVTLKNNIMSNLEIRTQRQISLNMSDLTINELHSEEYILGIGYKIKNVTLPIKI
ncbi:MAG TPA: cell surface protein SprA, partial [Bacteroidia bacterium]|nr:cell surface protein SprA [Bacteroidia bacterium]